MDSSPTICPKCDRPLPDGTPHELCPVCCLLNLGFGPSKSDEESIPGVELGTLLGKGTFGEVYEAIELHAGYRRVAVKAFRSDTHGSAQRARFLEEIQILAQLDHPNIARIFSSGRTSSGNPFYLMELIEGKPLDQAAASLDPAQRLKLLVEVARAVAHAHQKGIAHRDLKPSNIIVEEKTGQAKVIDFGIARAFEGPSSWGREGTLSGQHISTPRYMSPEQLAGDPSVDLRTDIFSLGLLIYELALGKPLLAGVIDSKISWEQNACQLRAFAFPRLDDRELDWIARKACALEPDDRYQTGQALLDDLEAKQNREPVSVGLSYRGYRIRKSLVRHRLAYAMTGAVFVLLAAATIFSVALSRNETKARLAIARENERALLAERDSRRTASDNSLFAGTRAMVSENYALARERFHQALELEPKNLEARYAQNYLDTLYPELRFIGEKDLPFTAATLTCSEGGEFIASDSEGRNWRIRPLSPPIPDQDQRPELRQEWRNKEGNLKAVVRKPGQLNFIDTLDGRDLFSPFIFGEGPELLAVSFSQSLVAVATQPNKVSFYSFEQLDQGFERYRFDSPIAWLNYGENSTEIWMMDVEGTIYSWRQNRKPAWCGRLKSVLKSKYSPWSAGDDHSHGLPEGSTGLLGLLQAGVWGMRDKKELVMHVRARNRNCLVASFADGGVYIQQPGEFYKAVPSINEAAVALAISRDGDFAFHVGAGNVGSLIEVKERKVVREWKISNPVLDAIVLDTSELVLAHSNGEISIWDPDTSEKPSLVIPAFPAGTRGVHVRSVPDRAEFVTCADGQASLRRFSARTGKMLGAPMRHDIGIQWLCFSRSGDFVFTVDQNEESPGTLRIWSLRLAHEIVPGIQHTSPITWAALLDEGRRLATACEDGTARRWVLSEK